MVFWYGTCFSASTHLDAAAEGGEVDGVIEAFFDKLSFFSVPLRLPAALEDAAPELPPGIETLFSWMKGNDEGWKKVAWSLRGLEAMRRF